MLNTIKKITEDEFNLPDISKRTKKQPYPEARAIYYVVAKERIPHFSYEKIANFIGRGNSAVINGVQKLKDTYLREKKFQELHKKVMDRAVMEVKSNEELFSEVEKLRQENMELKRKLELWKK